MPLMSGGLSSSVLRSYEYDTNTQLLVLSFAKGGGTYYYYNVPPAIVRNLVNASSPGTVFNDLIKGVYE
jgi:hypothetical protein